MENNENHTVQKPRPIRIICPDDHKFKLENCVEVKQIFESENLKNHELIVVSIAGALRKGKSFLLNFFLKYLNEHKEVCINYLINLNLCKIIKN